MMFHLTALCLVGAVVLGGATRGGYLGDVVVQIASVPLLVAGILALLRDRIAIPPRHAAVGDGFDAHGGSASPRGPAPHQGFDSHGAPAPHAGLDPHADCDPPEVAAADPRQQHGGSGQAAGAVANDARHGRLRRRACWMVLGAVVILALVQLVPLPPWLMPDIAQRLDVAALADAAPPVGAWRTLTIAPSATWAGLVSLLVPVAIFLAVAQQGEHARVRLAHVLVAISAVTLLLGLLQAAHGTASPLRFFGAASSGEPVGFFANRNHFAALMYVALVFASAWLVTIARGQSYSDLVAGRGLIRLTAAFGLVVAILAAMAMARSRAGMLLAMVALAGLVLLVRASDTGTRGANASRSGGTSRFAVVALGFALLFALQFGLHRIMTRFGADPLEDLRLPLTMTTLDAAWRAFPWGTGLGSFVPVFAAVERPSELLRSYANRAHNDWAEWFLETGALGVVLTALALVWFAAAAARAWRSHAHVGEHLILQRAATLAIVLLLAHSLVDYPLRTTALMSVIAFSAALLVPARHDAARAAGELQGGLRRPQPALVGGSSRSDARARSGAGAARTAAHHNVRLREKWKADVAWPQAWREGGPVDRDEEPPPGSEKV